MRGERVHLVHHIWKPGRGCLRRNKPVSCLDTSKSISVVHLWVDLLAYGWHWVLLLAAFLCVLISLEDGSSGVVSVG